VHIEQPVSLPWVGRWQSPSATRSDSRRP
jgi:hypothetical protein